MNFDTLIDWLKPMTQAQVRDVADATGGVISFHGLQKIRLGYRDNPTRKTLDALQAQYRKRRR